MEDIIKDFKLEASAAYKRGDLVGVDKLLEGFEERVTGRFKGFKNEINTLTEKLNRKYAIIDGNKKQATKYKREIDNITKISDELYFKKEDLIDDNSSLEEQLDELEEKYDRTCEKLEDIQEELRVKNGDIDLLNEETVELKQTIKEANDLADDMEVELQIDEETIKSLETENLELNEEITNLEEAISYFEEEEETKADLKDEIKKLEKRKE